MKLYRQRPLTVEAVQWTGDNHDEVAEFTVGGPGLVEFLPRHTYVVRGPFSAIRFLTAAEFNAAYEPLL